MKRLILLALLNLVLSLHPALAAESAKLTIAVAASVKGAMDEVASAFKKDHPEASVELISGSSGKFYEQIVQEAPFDLFFSADSKFPQQLKDQGLTATDVSLYARGRIVLWSAGMDAAKMDLKDLAGRKIGKIAIANPKVAPYGACAVEAMKKAGIWSKVEKKLVFGENIGQAAQFAESGAADVGIIALSQAVSSPLKEKGGYFLIPENMHTPLDQGYVVLKRAAGNPLAKPFADFVASEPARAIFGRYGFSIPGALSVKAP